MCLNCLYSASYQHLSAAGVCVAGRTVRNPPGQPYVCADASPVRTCNCNIKSANMYDQPRQQAQRRRPHLRCPLGAERKHRCLSALGLITLLRVPPQQHVCSLELCPCLNQGPTFHGFQSVHWPLQSSSSRFCLSLHAGFRNPCHDRPLPCVTRCIPHAYRLRITLHARQGDKLTG